MTEREELLEEILLRCQNAVPAWRGLSTQDFDFDDPKGFSSFTIGVRARHHHIEPRAVLYRQLSGKTNSILDFETERRVFLLLGQVEIAARCLAYEQTHRIEEFYSGRTLTAADVFDPVIQKGVADELYRLHQLEPVGLPDRSFFELLSEQWGELARPVLTQERSRFPAEEQAMCADLEVMLRSETLEKVRRCLPDRSPVFCHNDTYHGNVFLLDDGSVKLLDFEFSCHNHIAFDFANFFAETLMEHGLENPPFFRIGEPKFSDDDLTSFVAFYLDNADFDSTEQRASETARLVDETRRALLLSDYMYAMAGLPLALEPIQKLRFIPYAHQRFHRFLARWEEEFGPEQ